MNIVWRKKLKFIALLHFLIVCLQHENIKFLSCLDARSKSAYIVFFRAREVTSRVNLLSARVLSRLWRKSSSDMYFFFNATFLILLRRIERISLIAIITRVIQCVCAYLLYLFSQKQNALADVLLSFCVLIIMIIIVCAKSLFNAVSLLRKKNVFEFYHLHVCNLVSKQQKNYQRTKIN